MIASLSCSLVLSFHRCLIIFLTAYISRLLLFHISLIAFVYILAIMSMLVRTHYNYVSLFESRYDHITPGVYNGITSTVVLRLVASAYSS